MKLNDEFLAFETQFSNLCPWEGIYLCVVLKHDDPHMSYGQVQTDPFVILQIIKPSNVNTAQNKRLSFVLLNLCIYSFILLKSTTLLLRGATDYSIDTVSELTHQSTTVNCESRTLPKVLMWRRERDSNLQTSGRKAPDLPLSRYAPKSSLIWVHIMELISIIIIIIIITIQSHHSNPIESSFHCRWQSTNVQDSNTNFSKALQNTIIWKRHCTISIIQFLYSWNFLRAT